MAYAVNERGWVDTRRNIQDILKADTFLTKLVTRNATLPTLKASPVSTISGAVQVFCGVRYLAHGFNQRSLDYIKALVIGELMAPVLPCELCLPEVEANKEFMFVCSYLIDRDTAYNRGKTGQAWIADINAMNARVADSDKVPLPDLKRLTREDYEQYLIWLVFTMPKSQYMSALQLIVTSYVGAAKRGTVSERFIDKITSGIRDDLGEEITLDTDVIHTAYTNFGRHITAENAEEVFDRWLTDIPEHALRLRLTLEQVSGSGLTAFLITGRAIKKYTRFPWGRLNKLTDGEMNSYLDAVRLVDGNVYFGFNRDLRAAKSTNYSSVAYVAKELLIQIAGEMSLKNYQGWIKKPKSPAVIKQLIDDYVAKHNEGLMNAEITEAELSEGNAIVDIVGSESNLNLFS